jgi:hypothetical protein
MNSRQRIKAIIAGDPADRCGFWLGNPDKETWPILHKYFGTATVEELRRKLGDDLRWICPQFIAGVYQGPKGLGLFEIGLISIGQISRSNLDWKSLVRGRSKAYLSTFLFGYFLT